VVAAPPRKSKAGIIAGVVVAVVVLACAIPVTLRAVSGGSTASPSSSRTTRSGTDPSPTPSATAGPPVSPEEYQQVLAAIEAELKGGFQALAQARKPAAVHDAAQALESSTRSAASRLGATEPPAAAHDLHQQVAEGLSSLSTELGKIASGAESANYCTGSPAMAELSQSAAVSGLREKAKALATVDPGHAYKLGSFLPPPSAEANRRLGNGALIKKAAKSGSGKLKISNGGTVDAVINVVPARSKTATTMVYVRASGEYTLSGIRDGTYEVYLATGEDWDGAAKSFTRSCDYSKFDDPFPFTTKAVSGGTQYTIWSITLTPVVGGNARTSDVDPGSFPG
jgi:hypothetical protein